MTEQMAWLGKTLSDQAEDAAVAAYKRQPQEMELRREAAELIERLGWSQGNWVSRRGEVCLEEALNRVCRYQPLGLIDALKHGLEHELGSWDLTQWNDAEGRTQAEVLAALRGTS